MSAVDPKDSPALEKMVALLSRALQDRLRSVVLYGSAARGDFQESTSDLNLLIVAASLDPPTLEALAPALAHWQRQRQPPPRLFSPQLIADSADVFPIEFHDIRQSHVVLHGEDPLAGLSIDDAHLRIQCERELKEKMMRLREGYVEAHATASRLRRLLTDSYTSFVAIFRGCLHLLGGEVPVHNRDVASAFCTTTGVDPAPFEEVDRLRSGEAAPDLRALFARYYDELGKAVSRVDRFEPQRGGRVQ